MYTIYIHIWFVSRSSPLLLARRHRPDNCWGVACGSPLPSCWALLRCPSPGWWRRPSWKLCLQSFWAQRHTFNSSYSQGSTWWRRKQTMGASVIIIQHLETGGLTLGVLWRSSPTVSFWAFSTCNTQIKIWIRTNLRVWNCWYFFSFLFQQLLCSFSLLFKFKLLKFVLHFTIRHCLQK